MSDWHPILAAVEARPGLWRMVDPSGREYGTVELVRVRDGDDEVLRYKCVRDAEVIGWATTLRRACEGVHQAFLRSHGPSARIAPDRLYPDLNGHVRGRGT